MEHAVGAIFDLNHSLYIIVSLALTAFLIWLGARIKTENGRHSYLCLWGLLTFFLHISWLWSQFLTNGGEALAPANILFPIYFCNLCMYTLCVCGLLRRTDTRLFRLLATFTAYGAFFGSMISLFYPDYYIGSTEGFFEWGVFKSLLSHSTMLVGALYLFTSGYVRVRWSNLLVFGGGLLICGGIGLGINALFTAVGIESPNAMYWDAPPITEAAWITNYVIAAAMLAVSALFILIVTSIRKRKAN